MDLITRIIHIISPSLTHEGYRLVHVKLADGAKRKTLSVMVERTDEAVMSFDDCAAISHTVSALLDVEDPIRNAYHLEVCSPGIDRPLVRLEDYQKYRGHEAKLETNLPILGQRRFRGVIRGIESGDILIEEEVGLKKVPLSNVKQAKLMLTDALIAQFLPGKKTPKMNPQKKAVGRK